MDTAERGQKETSSVIFSRRIRQIVPVRALALTTAALIKMIMAHFSGSDVNIDELFLHWSQMRGCSFFLALVAMGIVTVRN